MLVIGAMTTGCRWTKEALRATPVVGDYLKSQSITILIWKNYLPPEVIRQFENEFGIDVIDEYFESNDELLQKVVKKKYDLAMPSSFKAKEMMGKDGDSTSSDPNYLAPLNPLNIPNLANLDSEAYNSKFDLTNKYVVPYIWGSTGIGYRINAVEGIPRSWASLFKSATKEKAATVSVKLASEATANGIESEVSAAKEGLSARKPKRRIAVLDDARFALGSALIYLKRPLATAGKTEIEEAGELIKSLGDEIIYIDGDNIPGLLARNELEMNFVMAWSGDATRAMRGFTAIDDRQQKVEAKIDNIFVKNSQVRLALPAEGSLLFRDCFVVPRNAENQAGAEKFINFLLRPDIAGKVSNYSCYANTLRREKVMPYVDRFVANSASYFTNPAGSKFNVTFDDIPTGMEPVYRSVWLGVKASLKNTTQQYPPIRARLYPDYPAKPK
jgi:spermidine/putrescine transport system substrate-binding protein